MPESREVLVPVCDLGAGVVWVRDARTGGRLRVPTGLVRLVNCVAHVVAESHGVEDGFHRVTLPGGIVGWVRAAASAGAGSAAA